MHLIMCCELAQGNIIILSTQCELGKSGKEFTYKLFRKKRILISFPVNCKFSSHILMIANDDNVISYLFDTNSWTGTYQQHLV